MAEAHALGLIHRDIEPGNVFLCRRGGVPDCVKVLNFGLVREYHASGTGEADPQSEQMIEGTPWFMPPEAIQGSAPSDPRSDLYSLGALGYFLLTGGYIFDAETISELHEKQLTSAPVPPSQRTAQPISAEMESLLLRCLEKDMNLRPASALELRTQLLATPAAADWTPAARAKWWDDFDRQPAPSEAEVAAISATPLPTVSVDLADRIE